MYLREMILKQDILKTPRPYLIAGPCSAESEEQLNLVFSELSSRANLLRAGIWKPRTRPNSFEGLGEVALPWVVNAAREANLPVSVEIANKHHVESALKAGIDVLWIGARTTVNPFAVQEIADALKGVNIPVMIKNPVNPDLQLWIGAFERLMQVGVEDLTAIHRGFSFYNHAKYRNVPSWEIPIGLKEQYPDIPIICDPSHIGGRRDLLSEISQKAMDLNFNGLMIETHPNPEKAWSDSKQQITPEVLKELISSLVLRSEVPNKNVASIIDDLRDKVLTLDDHLFDVLKERMLISEEIGQLKRENKITILQEEHWKKVINARMNQSEEYNLTTLFIRRLMDAIHQESIRHQTKVMNPGKKEND